MRMLFLGCEVMDVTDATLAKPPVAQGTEFAKSMKKDGQAISILSDALDKPILDLILGCQTAQQISDKLKTIQDRRAKDNIHNL